MDLKLADELGIPHTGMPDVSASTAVPITVRPRPAEPAETAARQYMPIPRRGALLTPPFSATAPTATREPAPPAPHTLRWSQGATKPDTEGIGTRDKLIAILVCVVVLLGGGIAVAIVVLGRKSNAATYPTEQVKRSNRKPA
jgi:hypothetical protein